MSKAWPMHNIVRHSVIVLTIFAVATGMALLTSPQKVSADQCSINGRDCYFGYFFNGYDGGPNVRRSNVLRPPALLNIWNANDFVRTLWLHMGGCPGGVVGNPNDQNATGAAFIILTMIGALPGTPKNVACQRFGEWEARVYEYDTSGLINFNIVQNFGGINTRSTLVDVSYYPSNGAAPSIVFYSASGQPLYSIKRDCGNPIGQLQGLPPTPYNIQPIIDASVNGGPVSGVAEVGDSITFNYRLVNTTPYPSPSISCSQYSKTHSGYYQHPNPTVPEPGGTPGATSCPQTIPPWGNNQARSPETIVVATSNITICRMLYAWPASTAGETKGYEVCVAVGSKPYLKVYGGDVSVGGNLESAPGSCTSLTAGAVSWNRKLAGHPGAGTQFGALATGLIREFATAQGNAGGAPAGAGLAFANTVNNPGAGEYGGNFGTTSCIRDFYDYAGGAPATPANVSSMNPDVPIYATPGDKTLGGGNISPDQRTTVYIDGDLYLTGNINYVGSWDVGSMPRFMVVVQGNIYIDNDVTNLDGIYIAQRKASEPASGTIYTCTTSAAIPAVAAGAFYNNCNNKLTVNGAFIAYNVEFLRTRGSQRGSTSNEASGSTNIAEVFNYGPAFWIPQPAPAGGGTPENYDSIISLPPVL